MPICSRTSHFVLPAISGGKGTLDPVGVRSDYLPAVSHLIYNDKTMHNTLTFLYERVTANAHCIYVALTTEPAARASSGGRHHGTQGQTHASAQVTDSGSRCGGAAVRRARKEDREMRTTSPGLQRRRRAWSHRRGTAGAVGAASFRKPGGGGGA